MGIHATDWQKRRAAAALEKLIESGLSVADVASRLGFESRHLQRFRKTRTHLGAGRCAAVVDLAAKHRPMQKPARVADVPDSMPAEMGEPKPAPVPALAVAPVALVTVQLSQEMAAALDAELARMQRNIPGVEFSRDDAARSLLYVALTKRPALSLASG